MISCENYIFYRLRRYKKNIVTSRKIPTKSSEVSQNFDYRNQQKATGNNQEDDETMEQVNYQQPETEILINSQACGLITAINLIHA